MTTGAGGPAGTTPEPRTRRRRRDEWVAFLLGAACIAAGFTLFAINRLSPLAAGLIGGGMPPASRLPVRAFRRYRAQRTTQEGR